MCNNYNLIVRIIVVVMHCVYGGPFHRTFHKIAKLAINYIYINVVTKFQTLAGNRWPFLSLTDYPL